MARKKSTVCESCFCASCFQGEFYCEDYKTSGTVKKSREELAELDLESPHYWECTNGSHSWADGYCRDCYKPVPTMDEIIEIAHGSKFI